VNVTFYAVLLWLPFFGVGVLRRRRRISRGLCPSCTYPIGTSGVCTECGRELPKRT
jgi:predicted amidophosphoribosyltransferase